MDAELGDNPGVKELESFSLPTRMGRVYVAVGPGGVVGVGLPPEGEQRLTEVLAKRVGPGAKLREVPAQELEAGRWLMSYLSGGRPGFGVDVDLSGLREFTVQVLMATRTIPYGATVTYATLAAMVGRPAAARAVGRALGANPVPVFVPCHRVVAAHGLGGFTSGVEMKRALLAMENHTGPVLGSKGEED